ncbi:hypothetical protein SNE40_012682 [Patella caerulea]|uniref:Uncharacterized protein n=1 Tax=Patella caerulea TaxID=87958 RepID=A0AAN8JRR9_PATCE
MIFMMGQAVYYHKEDIFIFLDKEHGFTNTLLKAVHLDIQENLYLSGCKALGLISKFVTAPLWRIIEAPGHILDMNEQYYTLVKFLDRASSDIDFTLKFMNGECTPFENTSIDDNDKISRCLIIPNEEVDVILGPLLQSLFTAIKELLLRMVPEHLPGGKFWNPDESLMEEVSSAKKHNKLPEFVFGQLDHLISYRPNASLLANEAYIMFSFNKTSTWLRELGEDEKNRLLDDSRKEGREIRKEFIARTKSISDERFRLQKLKKQEMERLEASRVQRAECMTNDVCYYGLWQTVDQINEGMDKLSGNDKELRCALQTQLKFRKSVLHQKHSDKQIFNLSKKEPGGKYRKLSVKELKDNLCELVKTALDTGSKSEVSAYDVPLLVNKRILHKFADGQEYPGYVINVVPGFPQWYNVKFDNDDAIYSYNLHEDYKKGDLKLSVSQENA